MHRCAVAQRVSCSGVLAAHVHLSKTRLACTVSNVTLNNVFKLACVVRLQCHSLNFMSKETFTFPALEVSWTGE